MKSILFPLAFAMIAIGTLNAQTYTIPPVSCGAYNPASYYCPPMEVSSAGVTSSLFYMPLYQTRLNNVDFKGRDGLGRFAVTSIVNTFDGTVHTQTVTGTWFDSSSQQYNLTSTITYTTYYFPGGGGRGCGGCGTKWNVTGGTATVVKINY